MNSSRLQVLLLFAIDGTGFGSWSFPRRACFRGYYDRSDFLMHLSDPKSIKDPTEMHFCYANTALLSYLVFGGVVYLRSERLSLGLRRK